MPAQVKGVNKMDPRLRMESCDWLPEPILASDWSILFRDPEFYLRC